MSDHGTSKKAVASKSVAVAAQAAEPSAAAPQPVIRSAEQERDAFEALVTPESRANVSPATREGWFDWFHEGWQAARAVPPALETSYEERAELEWLRSVEAAARAYFCRYVVDEAEDEDACHNAEQHALAKDLQTALRNYGMRFPKPRAEETTENTA